jgi:hypothetical protein
MLTKHLASCGVLVGFGQAEFAVGLNLSAVEQPGGHHRVGKPAQLPRAGDVGVAVVQAGHQRTPVQHHSVVPGVLKGDLERTGGDVAVDRLDPWMVDAGFSELPQARVRSLVA